MSKNTLLDKVVEECTVCRFPDGTIQLYVDLHMVHEVTSAPAFARLDERGRKVLCPGHTFATADHIVPTTAEGRQLPMKDPLADTLYHLLKANTAKHSVPFFDMDSAHQGIVHIIAPEMGLTQPGMVVACGDSHTSTHGAFGCVAFGIGTTEVEQVLGTQSLPFIKPKVRRIEVNGELPPGASAKDIALALIRTLGVGAGTGFAYEYAGSTIDALSMEARMTLCNLSIEGNAACGYVNPDQTTVDYLRDRLYAPKGAEFDAAATKWLAYASGPDAEYDDVVKIDAATIAPMVTWGTNPGQSIGVDEIIPVDGDVAALEYMGFKPGEKIAGQPIDVVFIGSCTNGRISDLRDAAGLIRKFGLKVAPTVQAIVVPGSAEVRKQAEEEGLDKIFLDAGFEFRLPGCSMCLGMNPDQLKPGQRSLSTSNRNFKNRQGTGGRTVLGSPATAVASAALGVIADVRELRINRL
jgi:3-isopropylmalate/(R)-2-methylmalate dehydratase large subunit